MLCYSMSQSTAFGAWLYAGDGVSSWNTLLSALAEQLFAGAMCVAKVPVDFIVTAFRKKENQSKAI